MWLTEGKYGQGKSFHPLSLRILFNSGRKMAIQYLRHFWISVGLLTVLSTNGLCNSRVQDELDGVLRGTQLSGASDNSAYVLHLAAVHTWVCILLWLQFQQNFLSIRPGGATLKVCSFKLLFWLLLLVLQIN